MDLARLSSMAPRAWVPLSPSDDGKVAGPMAEGVATHRPGHVGMDRAACGNPGGGGIPRPQRVGPPPLASTVADGAKPRSDSYGGRTWGLACREHSVGMVIHHILCRAVARLRMA